MFISGKTKCSAGIVALISLLFVPIGLADVSETLLQIDAYVEGAGAGTPLIVTEEDGYWDGDTFYWELGAQHDFGNGAYLNMSDPNGDVHTNFTLVQDPQVTLDFAMQAGSAGTTTFTAKSALLSFDPITNPQSIASVGMQVSDFDGGGAVLEAVGDGAFLAQYNGFVPGGSTFAELIDRIEAGWFDTEHANASLGWEAIPAQVSNISTMIEFTLTANDLASGTSSFTVVPEPATGLLLVLVGLTLVRRR